MSVLAAVIWHFWLGVAISALVAVVIVATVAGYLKKVVEPRYPKGRR